MTNTTNLSRYITALETIASNQSGLTADQMRLIAYEALFTITPEKLDKHTPPHSGVVLKNSEWQCWWNVYSGGTNWTALAQRGNNPVRPRMWFPGTTKCGFTRALSAEQIGEALEIGTRMHGDSHKGMRGTNNRQE